MSGTDAETLREATRAAIRDAILQQKIADKNDLFGFALCTDDDVTTLFCVFCAKAWVTQRAEDYPEIGYIFTEWQQEPERAAFSAISATLAALAKRPGGAETDARDGRFEALTAAMEDCRRDGLFDRDTLLSVASTDPDRETQILALKAARRLNSAEVFSSFSNALGFEPLGPE